jgi:alanine racemase
VNRGASAEIDLNALSGNLELIRRLSKNRPVIAVVKADAYGHGAVEISKRLARDGVEYLAVAFTQEAKELRNAGIASPIIALFDPDVKDIFDYDLIPVISDKKTALLLSKESEKRNKEISVHIKVDTGMGRLGLICDKVREIFEIAGMRGIRLRGVMSHFSEADIRDAAFVKNQIEKFRAIRTELLNGGLKIDLFHMANSAAVAALPESHFDAVRPGIMLYGYSPIQQPVKNSELIPVMTVKAKILALRKLPAGTPISYGRTFITRRESLIGVMSAGYADGLSRKFSNNAEFLVKGKRAPVAGRVCMDLTMIDVTDIEGVLEGDEVVILGRQGNEAVDASELAIKADTISYEILTSLGSRAEKAYIE